MGDLALAALARGEGWTEERHAAFLDRMELSFVQQLLAGSSSSDDDVRQASRRLSRRRRPQAPPQPEGHQQGPPLPLDRPLPDSAVESNRPAPEAPRRQRVANDDARRPVDPAAGF
ncbi:hypothetical protein HU200_008535 [Digitaria exilis]|uniref:Uncharacterized protein n=1 Tax=Digitaria exilis TaxID=1010633 RepID=A0A835KRI8_9POAL|nr:hypothetical protein HU200_008535 [Digitaria exilis]